MKITSVEMYFHILEENEHNDHSRDTFKTLLIFVVVVVQETTDTYKEGNCIFLFLLKLETFQK